MTGRRSEEEARVREARADIVTKVMRKAAQRLAVISVTIQIATAYFQSTVALARTAEW